MNPNPNQRPFEQRVQDASARVEEELRRVVRYLDEEVVPEVRRNGSTALRAAAAQLQRLAQTLEDAGPRTPDADPRTPGSSGTGTPGDRR
ncbi:MAG TPA: hypothetical protein VM865_08125 [Acidobacteriaceae bacterium]|nr:hypothetical protein [Acidobacteriaceae bacterium]